MRSEFTDRTVSSAKEYGGTVGLRSRALEKEGSNRNRQVQVQQHLSSYRLYFPASPEARCSYMTTFWLMECEACIKNVKKWCWPRKVGDTPRLDQAMDRREECSSNVVLEGALPCGEVTMATRELRGGENRPAPRMKPVKVLTGPRSKNTQRTGSFTRLTMNWHLLPPFGPSRILPVNFQRQHCVLYLGPPVVRQLMQVVIILPDQGRWFQSAVP
ncbi:uncharacterized protein [Kogia breviceps]|uniref:uncharacterized protein n=1 Tax=Kogia breviceps TaxID=27615 RepID=UPI0034D25EAF